MIWSRNRSENELNKEHFRRKQNQKTLYMMDLISWKENIPTVELYLLIATSVILYVDNSLNSMFNSTIRSIIKNIQNDNLKDFLYN